MTEDALPRILFESVPDDVRPLLEDLPGTHTWVEVDDQIHASDHDLVVTWGYDAAHRPQPLHVLAFGAGAAVESGRAWDAPELVREHEVHARRAHLASGVTGELARLLERTVLEVVPPPPRAAWSLRKRVDLSGGGWGFKNLATTTDLIGAVEPLVVLGAEAYPYAIKALRAGAPQQGVIWALPAETAEPRAWVLHVLEELTAIDPGRFPEQPTWHTQPAWATPDVLTASSGIAALADERERVLGDLDRRSQAASDRLDAAVAAAIDGQWRLLTEQGDRLVAAVGEALATFGFEVTDVDLVNHATNGRRLEDLRVEDPEISEWESLVEVKGYTRGARVNDVAQILGAPSTYFAIANARPPAAVWHVVNVQLGVAPGLRAAAIPNDADLASLAEAGGALIDTRDLFRAWRAVAAGEVAPVAVRESLRAARTRWNWPSEE